MKTNAGIGAWRSDGGGKTGRKMPVDVSIAAAGKLSASLIKLNAARACIAWQARGV